MSGRHVVLTMSAGILLAATAAAGDTVETKSPAECEIRVFVSDRKGAFLGGDKASVTLNLDGAGDKRTLKTEAVALAKVEDKAETKEGAKADVVPLAAMTHGGKSILVEGYSIEFLVTGSTETRDGTRIASTAVAHPYFAANSPFVGYQDAMKCAPPSDKPGKCPKCGMEMTAQTSPFTAEVVVKIGERTLLAKGFQHPRYAAMNFAGALQQIEGRLAEIDQLVSGKRLGDVHGVAAPISTLAESLEGFAPVADKAVVAGLGREIVLLLDALDRAATSGKVDEMQKVLAQYREKLAYLRKFA